MIKKEYISNFTKKYVRASKSNIMLFPVKLFSFNEN